MTKKVFIILIILLLLTPAVFSKVKKSDIPKNVKIIEQTLSDGLFILTVVDMDNNEIVIIHYYFTGAAYSTAKLKLKDVIRTGMIYKQ